MPPSSRLNPREQAELAALQLQKNTDLAAMTEVQVARMRELQRIEEGILDSSEKRVERLTAQIDLLAQEIELNETLKELNVTVVGLAEKRLRQQDQELERRKELLQIAHENHTVVQKAGETQDEAYKRELRQLALDRERLEVKKQGYNDSESFAKRFMGITREPSSEFGKFLVDPSARLEGLTSGLSETVDGMSILTSTVDKVVEATMALAFEQDQAVVNFRKATGATGEFDSTITGLERSLFTAGVGATEAGQAVQSLFLNVTDFTEMSEKQQETLGKTVAVLNELGVATEATAKNMQFAIKVMGKSADQAAELQRELFTFAQDLGVSGAKMAEDFAAMGPQIAALGTKGVDAFRQLEVQAKNTGLALTEILGVVEKFDKFDSAADSVSRLNALLGGPYLNALELVAETDPSKRFEILKDRIDDAGLSFDTMDYYQRKAIASAMGLNEQQLALMMRGRLDLIREPAKSAADIEKLAEQTAQFNTLMEELMQAGRALAVSFGPLIQSFKHIVQLLSPLLTALSKAPGMIFGLIAGVSALTRGFSIMSLSLNELTKVEKRSLLLFIGFSGMQLVSYVYELAGGLAALATAFGVVAVAVWGLKAAEKGSVILAVGGLIISVLSMLAHAIAVGNSPSLVEAFYMVAAAIPFMTLALLGLMPLLPALLLLIPPLALGFAMIASTLTDMLSDKFVTNLQLMAVEIANIVDKINELSTLKATAFAATAVVTAGSTALIKDLDTATLDKISTVTTANTVATTNINQTNAAAAAGAGMPTGFEGPPPTINVNLSIDGKEFATTVNSVDVSKYIGGKSSNLYNSIVDMIGQGINTGKGAP